MPGEGIFRPVNSTRSIDPQGDKLCGALKLVMCCTSRATADCRVAVSDDHDLIIAFPLGAPVTEPSAKQQCEASQEQHLNCYVAFPCR